MRQAAWERLPNQVSLAEVSVQGGFESLFWFINCNCLNAYSAFVLSLCIAVTNPSRPQMANDLVPM